MQWVSKGATACRPSGGGIRNAHIGVWLCVSHFACTTNVRREAYTWEIIVVDDGSRDRTCDVVRQYCTQEGSDSVRLLRLHKNHGKGGAVRKVRGLYCCGWRFQAAGSLMSEQHLWVHPDSVGVCDETWAGHATCTRQVPVDGGRRRCYNCERAWFPGGSLAAAGNERARHRRWLPCALAGRSCGECTCDARCGCSAGCHAMHDAM